MDYKIRENLDIKISNGCNLKCAHCCMGDNLKNNEVNFEKIHHLIESNPQIKEIHLGGGEPLITDEHTKKVLHLIQSFPKIRWKMATNLCYTLTDDRIEVIRTLYTLKTSFDIGMRFNSVRNLIRWMRNVVYIRNHIRDDIDVICCLTKPTIRKGAKRLQDLFNKLGLKYKYTPIISSGSYTKNYDDLGITKEEFHDWLRQIIELRDLESNQTFELIYTRNMTACHYGTECMAVDIDATPVNCSIYEKMYDNCMVANECLMCDDYKECGGRCVLVPCLYDKDLYAKCKALVDEARDKKRRGV